jgi:peptidoglycan-N-acetylmuramic acid deacetylase
MATGEAQRTSLRKEVTGQEIPATKALYLRAGGSTLGVEELQRLEKMLLELMPEGLAETQARFDNPREATQVRALAARMLARVRGAKAVPALQKALRDQLRPQTTPLGPQLVLALGLTQSAQAVDALKEIADRNDPGLRWAVATALGTAGQRSAVPVLLRLLRDDDLAVQAASHRALVRLTGLQRQFSPDASVVDRLRDLWAFEEWWSKASGKVSAPGTPDSRPEVDLVLSKALDWALRGRGGPPAPAFPALNLVKDAREVVVLDRNLPKALLPLEGLELVSMPPSANPVLTRLPGYVALDPVRIQGSEAEVTLRYQSQDTDHPGTYGAAVHLSKGAGGWSLDRVIYVTGPGTQPPPPAQPADPSTAPPPAPVSRVATQQMAATITVEMGANAPGTQRVAQVLSKLATPATFFVTPEQLSSQAPRVKELSQKGIPLALLLPQRPGPLAAEDLTRLKELFRSVVGSAPAWVRAPGRDDEASLRVLQVAGLRPVSFTLGQPKGAGTESSSLSAFFAGLAPGAILRVEDGNKELADFLPDVIRSVRRRGYRLLPLDELLALAPAPVDERR